MSLFKKSIIITIVAAIVQAIGYLIRKEAEQSEYDNRRTQYMMDRLEEAVEGAKTATSQAWSVTDKARGMVQTLHNLIGEVAEPTPTQVTEPDED